MKVLILAGGKGTRYMEETLKMPKPMIPLLNKPMIFHIMEHYISYDYKEFVILGGEKVEYIYDYFKKNFNVVDEKNFIFDINDSFIVQVLDTVQIPARTTLEVLSGQKYILETTDVLRVKAGTGSALDATLGIMEIT